MSPSQPSTVTGAEEQILLTVADQSKLDLIMELPSHFDLVRAERVKAPNSVEPTAAPEPTAMTPEQKARKFLQSAGIWEGRDIDAQELRQRAWQRDHTRRS